MEEIQKDVNLAKYTTYGIGGNAKFFAEPSTEAELMSAFIFAEENKEKIYLLGGGSNVLINDKGVNGLVIRILNDSIEVKSNRLLCGAGATLLSASSQASRSGLLGLGWSLGIPRATIGGAVRGNAGAFGSNMEDIVETVEVFDTQDKKFKIFSNNDCKFGYRESIFKKEDRYIIWEVTFKMKNGTDEEVKEESQKSLSYRNEHHPKLPSAGSIFKNISVEYIKEANPQLFDNLNRDGIIKYDKVGVGYFIELPGLKGKSIGGAKVSLEHANFIVNTGKATAQDVIDLIKLIKKQVKNMLKLDLEEEVQYLGFDE